MGGKDEFVMEGSDGDGDMDKADTKAELRLRLYICFFQLNASLCFHQFLLPKYYPEVTSCLDVQLRRGYLSQGRTL